MPIAIDKPSKYFNTKLYTGNGSTSYAITGVGFKPDFLWIKSRSDIYNHNQFDVIRGTKYWLGSNTTSAEDNNVAYPNSFDSDGFTLNNGGSTNNNGTTYASWNWLASNTTASNNSGSITSTVSANTTSGFSIVSFTGTGSNATIGHGLGVAPKMIIFKTRSSADNWVTWHGSFAVNEYVYLNLTNAKTSLSTFMNSTLPSSSVISLGTWANVNTSSQTMIAYCFAEVKGFSKAFSYTGNGSADGSFVYCGFLPSFVLLKRTDSAFGWYIYDTKRRTFNQNNVSLSPNASDAEDTASGAIDILSNGFKLRNSDGSKNASGGTYIGIAFASNPFVSSKGIPTCAF